jgi:hypothetical protein
MFVQPAPAIRKMRRPTSSLPPFVVMRSIVSTNECDAILDSEFFRYRYYRSDGKFRRVDIAYIERKAAPELYELIAQLARKANPWKLSLNGITEDLRIQRYRKEDYTDTHTDYDYSESDFSKLTVVIPLVDRSEWIGGDLEIGNSRHRPRIGIGDAVVFPSFTPHSVTRIVRGARVILSAWVSGPPLR